MQFQVPQFIETEDKIVGPLTLRQFIYIGIGGGMSALLYFTVQTWLWAILSAIIVGVAVSIAFVKVEGRPLARVILSAFNFYWRPQAYVWKPEQAPARKAPAATKPREAAAGIPLEDIIAGVALHKSWERLQTGTPDVAKTSDKEFIERRMERRYQIFEKVSGERAAARRVDYR